jgi:type IV pilus assembly protein PilM
MAKNRAVGLDIGSRTVTVAVAANKGGKVQVVNYGQAELPEDAVREGEVLQPDAVSQTIRTLLSDTGIKDKKVNLGIANQRVVVRQVDLPNIPLDELRRSLPFTVQEFIPMPAEDAELDFHVLEEHTNEAGAQMLRALLVAAQKDMVASHIAVAKGAGLKPIGVDLNPFAVLRALNTDSVLGDEPTKAYIDVGAGVTSIVVAKGEVPLFVRILVLGGNDVTAAVSAAEGLPYPEAEARKRELGMTGDDATSRAIADRAGQFVDEVRSSLDYFRAQSTVGTVESVILAGGGALLAGLPARLGQVLGIPVELARPFDRLPSTSGESDEVLEARGPLVATAIGLALGGLE